MFVKFIYFISSLFFIISLIPDTENTNNNSSETDDDYFINDMSESDYISQNTEPFHNFFNLNLENSTNNSYCDLCKKGFDIILNTLIQEYKWTYLHAFCTFGCSLKLRKDICKKLEFMGVEIDEEANNMRGEEKLISKTNSKVKVYVIPTNEELMIAKETERLI